MLPLNVRHRLLPLRSVVLAAALVLSVAAFACSGGSDAGRSPASTGRVLLEAEGWEIREAVESSTGASPGVGLDHEWYIEYFASPAPNTEVLVVLSAHPRAGGSAEDRSAITGPRADTSTAAVLGRQAIIVETQLVDGTPAGAWAFWEHADEVVMQFGSSELSADELVELFGSLREVDEESWRQATGAAAPT